MSTRREIVLGAVFLGIVSISMAQGPPGPGGGEELTISVDASVKSLNYSASAVGLFTPSGSTGSYVRTYTFTADVQNLPNGWTVLSYSWAPQWEPGSQFLPLGVLTFPFGTASGSAQGTAWSAGWGDAECYATLEDPTGQLHYARGTKTIAAIGGALSVSGYCEDEPTFDRDENDTTAPIYLQFFSHNSINVPALGQIPRKGRISPALGQPEGTTVDLNVLGPVSIVSETQGELKFATTGPSSAGGIVASSTFEMSSPGFTGSGSDCCNEMPNPESYKFTSHEPASVTAELKEEGSANGYDNFGNPLYGWFRRDWFWLYDNLGGGMPGVRLQERFDPNFDPAAGNGGNYWVTSSTPLLGRTSDVDFQGIQLGFPWVYAQHLAFYVHRQLIVAGTSDPTWYGASGWDRFVTMNGARVETPGVGVAYFRVSKWTDRIERVTEN